MSFYRWAALTSIFLLTVGLLAITPRHTLGQDWVGGNGLWHDPSNWHDGSVPGFGDLTFIGTFESTVQDLSIQLDQPVFAEDLRIGNGNRMVNRVLPAGDAFPMAISADLQITGENAFNPGPSQPAGLFLYPTGAPVDLAASRVLLSADSELGLREGAVADIGFQMTIGPSASLSGHGTVNLQGNATLNNNGVIDPRGELTINRQSDGLYDLDGDGEAGELWIGGSVELMDTVNDHLTINGTELADSFSGTILLGNNRRLTMNLSEGWTADSESSIQFSGIPDEPLPAIIDGGHVTLEGQVTAISAASSNAGVQIEADATINDGFSLWQGPTSRFRFLGTTTVNGGEFNLQPGAGFLRFLGPTTLRGGEFNTTSDSATSGIVVFENETQWDGEVTLNGVARQRGDATVTGPTTINAQRFDMDGVVDLPLQADWEINSNLTVNAQHINFGDENFFGSTMTIAGSATSRLNMNLTGGQWTMAGTLNVSNDLPFGATRLAGSKIWLKGTLNVDGSDVRVDADAAFGDGSITTFADTASSLSLRQHSRVYSGAEFVGDGLLQNAATGLMILNDGASTSNVGLRNAGVLDIDDEIGIVSVDRFENTATGTLAIDLNGYLLGEEFDHLQVAGSALLDGTLAVDLLTGGLIGDGLFAPQLGDEFLILNSLDGVDGEFTNVLPTVGDGNVYGWEVLYHPHDVTIRLASVGAVVPEPTSIALFAFGTAGLVYSRRR